MRREGGREQRGASRMPGSQPGLWPKAPDRTDLGNVSSPVALDCGLSDKLKLKVSLTRIWLQFQTFFFLFKRVHFQKPIIFGHTD